MKTSIITTTINIPTFLCEYYKNLEKYGHDQQEIGFIIVGDNRTPKITEDFVKHYSVNRYWTEYWSPQKQDKWLKEKFPNKGESLRNVIPENDMRRRNFGYLRALEMGSDIIITIDDDNYPLPNYDWLGLHTCNLGEYCQSISSANSFVNPCRFFDFELPFYSRGYPFAHLFADTIEYFDARDSRESVLNMGLWVGKPDVDSYTNIVYPDLKTEYSQLLNSAYSIKMDNYFPINTQNTSFKKELSIFHNLYMEPLYDLPSHRFDDIWAGLFCLKLIHKKGKTASFGTPLVEHRRNIHNYQKDLQTEFIGASLNTKMWDFIRDFRVHSTNYKDGFLEIAYGLEREFTRGFIDKKIIEFIQRLADSMVLWVELLDVLN